MKKILLLGSSGQLGRCILNAKPSGYKLLPFSHEELSISDNQSMRSILSEERPHYIINCAAYTKVEKAEDNAGEALNINYNSVKKLAHLSEEYKATLIHFSTDYVYDGESSKPYKEVDSKNPINVYGDSKLKGDSAIELICSKYYIFRISSVFSQYGNNFVKTMLNLSKKEEIDLVGDQFMNVTSAMNLANFLSMNFESQNFYNKEYGTYNFSTDKKSLSWFQFASMIFKLSMNLGLIDNHPSLNQINSNQRKSNIKRPLYTSLDISKLKNTFIYKELSMEEVLKEELPLIFKSL